VLTAWAGLAKLMPVIMIGVIGGVVAYSIVGLISGGPRLTPARGADHFDEPKQRLADVCNGS
jgi:hypothetical protein